MNSRPSSLFVYHIIWCPKRRRSVLVGPVHDRLKHIIDEVANEHGWQIIELDLGLLILMLPSPPDQPKKSPLMLEAWAQIPIQ